MVLRKSYFVQPLVGCLILLSLCACSNNSEVKTTSTVVSLDTSKEEKIEITDTSLEYVEGEDAQTFLYGAEVAKGEAGYYYWDELDKDGLGLLMYFDVTSGKSIPLCNEPNCNHDSTDCNAYFNRAGEEGDYFDRSFIQYYDGNIYIIGYDSEDNVNLYRVSADGSSWEKYMKLYKADLFSDTDDERDTTVETWKAPRVVLHRGYVYYLIWDESIPKIRRMKLGSDDTEIIFESNGERPSIDWMKIYGNQLFFKLTNYEDDNYEKFSSGIITYNIDTNEILLIKKGVIGDFVVANQKMYYVSDNGVCCYDFSTQEDTLVISDVSLDARIAVDAEYIYTFDFESGALMAYTLDGIEVASVISQDIMYCWMGDEQYFFARGLESKLMIQISDLSQGTAKWTAMTE